jgi:hypothetical protein
MPVHRLSLSSTGKVVYTLKTPYRDGTTQVAFDRGGHPPVDFVARLAHLRDKEHNCLLSDANTVSGQ